jgi:DNA-binding transcriptional MocR family regulator
MIVQNYISGATAVNIAASVERAVAAGRAAAGERLPSIRALAAHLGVNPLTVAAAYRLLQERAVVTAEPGRRGTRILPAPPIAAPAEAPLPRDVRDLASGNPDPAFLPDFRPLLARLRVPQRLYGAELNEPHLVALAQKQFSADRVPAAHVAVVSGALDGMERALRELLRPGDRVIVEDPCFTGVLDLLHSLALAPVPAQLDDHGLLPASLDRALRGGAKALIVTPRAQNPTGAALTPSRARELRAILRHRPDLLLVEDDHAGPVAGARYATLVDSSRSHWVVVRSVSKSLGPDLRVALVAGDAATIARIEGRQRLGIRSVSHVLQTLVAALWRNASVCKQLAAAERAYAERRAALIRELRERGIEAHGASGLNVWIPMADESGIARALFQRGWGVNAGERYRLASPSAIRVTVAALTPRDAARLANDLAEIVRPARRSARA